MCGRFELFEHPSYSFLWFSNCLVMMFVHSGDFCTWSWIPVRVLGARYQVSPESRTKSVHNSCVHVFVWFIIVCFVCLPTEVFDMWLAFSKIWDLLVSMLMRFLICWNYVWKCDRSSGFAKGGSTCHLPFRAVLCHLFPSTEFGLPVGLHGWSGGTRWANVLEV